ncbi:acyl-CoA reductase [Flavobacterium agricola]|uniref:Acyl-CoA reductase n=1 Tax=Flavobacterium agricola TaxID=2870839 RepID=A0ABY6M326_9FLAO|nr:acyl-CoA reductase [Flavobacterium agricola]UYW02247.1 acyl-CoA reductase [Flavobacterium agricola]
MIKINNIKTFVELGHFLSQFDKNGNKKKEDVLFNDEFYDAFIELIYGAQSLNGWFTPEQVYFAIQSWAEALTETNLNTWVNAYADTENKPSKTIGLILAGNIPLVGFHDFLSVLITGNKALVKLSSNDQNLLPFLASYLIKINPDLTNQITFVKGKLEGFDAVIATGSNNTSRYFDFYFSNVPNIIRKNRNSVAILTGNESLEQLTALGQDIFTYFGLGCRNVSKLFVPENYDFKLFFEAMYAYKDVIYYEKYANNYDYNKAVYLMSLFSILDNEFMTLKEDAGYASPISSVFYERYTDLEAVLNKIETDNQQIQCVVSNSIKKGHVAFGETQHPKLWDYADNVDTIQFLLKL